MGKIDEQQFEVRLRNLENYQDDLSGSVNKIKSATETIANIFRNPPVLLGLVAMLGLILQRKNIAEIIKGTALSRKDTLLSFIRN